MRETKSQGEEGYLYRHFTDQNYQALKDLEKQYKAMAFETKFYSIDNCNPTWMLTVTQVTI